MTHYYANKLLLGCWVALGVLIFFSSLKEQVFISRSWQKKIGTLFPEGWAFFTKSPREPNLYVYRIQPDGQLSELPVSNHDNPAWGLTRSSRLIGYEASMMANKLEASDWTKHAHTDLAHFVHDSVRVVEREPQFNHLTDGDYLFKLMEPVPFAWAGRNQENNTPFLIARIRIQ